MYTNKYFECTCSSIDHILRITEDEEWPYLYCNLLLNNNLPFYKRLYLAIKYIFKKPTSIYGMFEEIILDDKQAIELRDFLNEFINKKKST